MLWNTRLKNIRDVMTELFSLEQAIEIAEDAGINTNSINLPLNRKSRWHNIIKDAEKRKKTDALINAGLNEYPDNPNLLQLKSPNVAIRGPNIETKASWKDESNEETLEKIIGGSSQLLPISFLEKGSIVSSSVGRIITPIGEVGTGFLINNNLVVTNHHVLPTKEISEVSKMEFNFQKSSSGLDIMAETYYFSPEVKFKTSEADDLTVVALKEDASSKFGEIKVNQVETKAGERVSIIQHPGGLQKQVALHDNHVVYVGDGLVQYLTDTMPGSSGSPVFNQDWELIAIHHSGGWLLEPNTKRKYFRNEGIEVSKLLKLIKGI